MKTGSIQPSEISFLHLASPTHTHAGTPCRDTWEAQDLTLPLRSKSHCIYLGLSFPPLQNGNNVNAFLSGGLNASVNVKVLCKL